MVYVYVLKLQQGKYYVGKTSNPQFRLESHFLENGSAWTRMYKPTQLLELIPDCDNYDEDKYTQIYMDKYGVDNVRGGSYTSIELNASTRQHLLKKNHSANDRCFKCGKEGHFAKYCTSNDEDDDSSDYVWCCDYCDKEFEGEEECMDHEKKCSHRGTCFRCGRLGHYASSCYASTHLKGYFLTK